MLFGKGEAANGTGSGYTLVGGAGRSVRGSVGWGMGMLGFVAAAAMML